MTEPQKTGTDVWRAFQGQLAAAVPPATPLPISEGISLYHESTRAYEAKCFDLAALGCRAAIENASYLFLTRRPASARGWSIHLPFDMAGDIRTVDFSEILAALRKRKILSEDWLHAAKRIQEHGNVIAHYASKNDRLTHEYMRRTMEITRRGSRETVPELELGLAPLEVLQDLEDAGSILVELAKASVH